MTLYLIRHHKPYGLLEVPDQTALAIVNQACPGLRHVARADCANYLDCPPESLTIKIIEKHILESYQFDAVDVSRIVNAIARFNKNKTAS
jgi:hypothetical protein